MSSLHIAGFDILHRIGAGGMATVWKARQLSLDRIVAIKVLSSRLASDAEDIRRFQDEAHAEAKLKHPGIVQVYDANVEEGSCYIVMEYVDGYTVGDWLRRRKVLSQEDALLVVGYVAEALAYAWDKAGIIHCDIKPDNVMVDADGTIKVTDLGLARTISAMEADTATDEVMGTPAYMAPEQIRGETEMDCRTDIYALGAMCYQLVTGRMLFPGESDDRVMELQLSGTAPSPRHFNRRISPPMCAMLEKMLAKDRDHRYQDWISLLSDIRRIKRGLSPAEPIKKPGLSTLGHPQPKRYRSLESLAQRKASEESPKRLALAVTIAAFVGIAGGIMLFISFADNPSPHSRSPSSRRSAARSATRSQPVTPTTALDHCRELYEHNRAWLLANPDVYDEAIARLRNVMRDTQGTPYAAMAEADLKRLNGEREQAVRELIARLDGQADGMVNEGRWRDAVLLYRDYEGALADHTADTRRERARSLVERARRLQEAQKRRETSTAHAYDGLLDRVAATILGDGLRAALDVLEGDAIADFKGQHRQTLDELRVTLRDALDTDRRVLDSFQNEIGQRILVTLRSGPMMLTILGVEAGKVRGGIQTGESGATAELSFAVQDLTASARLARLVPDSAHDVALAKGLMALAAGSREMAAASFRRTHPALADRLAVLVEAEANVEREQRAEAALLAILNGLGAPMAEYDRETVQAWLDERDSVDEMAVALSEQLARFHELFGSSAFARAEREVLERLAALAFVPTAADEPVPAGADNEMILGLLASRNPRLTLEQISVNPKTKTLRIEGKELTDISGLVGQPLRGLELIGTRINNLRPLLQMEIETLSLDGSTVRDLLPLQGLKLTRLSIRDTQVTSLQPVAQMPLIALDASHTLIQRIDPLGGLPLQSLNLSDTRVYNFSPLQGLPLQTLNISGTQLTSLDVLAGLPLSSLTMARTAISDLSPLRGMKLRHLDCSGTRVASLDPLQGMPLHSLNLSQTRVQSLAPLEGMELKRLWIHGTAIANLDALRLLPLVHLGFRHARIKDYSVLTGISVRSIDVDQATLQKLDGIIRRMPKLRRVNNQHILLPGAG